MADRDISFEQDDLVPVKLPSGASFLVFRAEKIYIKNLTKEYLSHNAATNISDLQDMDRIVQMETLCHRWATWLSQRSDYEFSPIDEKELSKQLKDTSQELRQLKSSLGIDKVTREKTRGEGSVSEYLQNLRIRAKQFGVMRESQLDAALELFAELKSKVQFHENADDEERDMFDLTWTEIYEWIRDEAIPRFDAIDEHFRETQQRSWIRNQ